MLKSMPEAQIIVVAENCEDQNIADNLSILINFYRTGERMNFEDKRIRDFIAHHPSYLDLDDPTILAFDKDIVGYSAKDIDKITKKLEQKMTEETALEIAKQAYKEISFVIKHWENMEGLGISFCWDRCIAVDGYLFHSHQLEEK